MTDLGALTESLRDQLEGKSQPVGTFVKRKNGTFRKGHDGRWHRVAKTKLKLPRGGAKAGTKTVRGKHLFVKTARGGWSKSQKTRIPSK